MSGMDAASNRIPQMRRVRQALFVGIGGSGICGIALALLHQNCRISGTDISEGAGAVMRADVFGGRRGERTHEWNGCGVALDSTDAPGAAGAFSVRGAAS